MCGIAGIVDADAGQVGPNVFAATAQLRHRGPDGSDVWLENKGTVGLGHARLSIVDPEFGRQPLSNEDGSIQVTVNGEFYGADAIRERLQQSGHRFRSRSDSEVLPHLFEESGIACLRQLRGEFAFLLWDARASRLWAARDRFGVKPLFYCMDGGRLVVASEVKSLFAAGAPRGWDASTAVQQMFFFAPLDRTLFRGIYQLPPGHYLLYENGRLSVHQYWDIDYPEAGTYGTEPDTDVVENMQSAVSEAIHSRLRSDAPVTVFLSGGLDSSAVLAFACKAQGGLRALHVSFANTDLDEVVMARAAAAHVGAGLDVLEVGEQDLVDHLLDAVWSGEMLAFNAHGVARFLQSRYVKAAGYKVALTGEGGDETFGGYPGFRRDATDSDGGGGRWQVRVLRERLGFSPAWVERVHAERAPFYALLDGAYLSSFTFEALCEDFLGQFDCDRQLRGRHRLHQSMYLWMKSVLPNYTLYADRLDMAHGVETRPPLLDHLLWEHTRKLPPHMLIRGRTEKWILREISAGIVPDDIRYRPKHSFTAPGFSNSPCLREFTNDELRSAAFRCLPFFDHEAVKGLLEMVESSPAPGVDSTLMMLLCTHLLNKAYRLS